MGDQALWVGHIQSDSFPTPPLLWSLLQRKKKQTLAGANLEP